MSALSERVLPGDDSKALPPRLVIAPHIASEYASDGPLSWAHHQWNLPAHLMGWTDWRLAASQDWHGLAIVVPELTAAQLYDRTNFEEAWTAWALCDSHRHGVAVTVRNERSEQEFTFGNKRPKYHATVNVFSREFFEYYRMAALPGNLTLAWEHVFTTMVPGIDIDIACSRTLEQWLADDEITLPDIWMDHNRRRYEQIVLLKYGKTLPKPAGFRLERTARMPLVKD